MDYSSRRPPLAKGRRIPLNVTLSPETWRALGKIGRGNRSAAIEKLVELHAEPKPEPELVEPATT